MNAPTELAALVRPPFEPGVFRDMPFDVYRSIMAMSQSGARKILKSPMHYVFDLKHPSPPTESMQFGTAVHCGVLEPDVFSKRVARAPKVDKRTNAGKAEWAQFCTDAIGRVVLSADDYARALACIAAVRAHPMAAKLLAGAEVELSLFWNDGRYGVPCKARLDARNHGGIIDLKTTKDASPSEFAKSVATFRYHLQAAYYFSGCEHVLNETPQFFAFIAVESEPPHAVKCYAMPSNGILAGAHLMNRALELYAEALASGEWPGYSETLDVLQMPKWALSFNT